MARRAQNERLHSEIAASTNSVKPLRRTLLFIRVSPGPFAARLVPLPCIMMPVVGRGVNEDRTRIGIRRKSFARGIFFGLTQEGDE